MLKDNLISLRKSFNLSQEELADRLGVTRQTISKYETGAAIPDVEKCKQIADIYGVTVDSLLETITVDGKQNLLPPPKGKNIWGFVTINERGQIVIPKKVRDLFGLSGGQRLIVLTDETEGIALVPAEIFENRLKQTMTYASENAGE